MKQDKNKQGFAHLVLLAGILVTMLLAGALYFAYKNNTNTAASTPNVAGVNTEDDSPFPLKNSRFDIQSTLPLEIARYWLFFPGQLGNVTATISRASNTPLADASMILITVTDKPLLAQPHLQQRSVPLKPNTKYQIKFSARSSAVGRMRLVIKDMALLKQQLVPTQTFSLQNTGWASYVSTFTTGNFNAANGTVVTFYFDIPRQSTVSLDNVFLRELVADGDRDGDGVLDSVDMCIDTPKGSNPDPARPGCPRQDLTKKSKKWQPGHYITVGAASQFGRFSGPQYKNVQGFRPKITWNALEGPNKGQYHFEVIRTMLDALPEGKKLFIMIEDRTFKNNCNTEIPTYMRNPQNAIITDKNNCSVKIWEAGAMGHMIDLYKAIGDEFDDDPRFMGIMNQETANPQTPKDKGDDLRTQLIRLHREISPHFEKSHVFQTMNHLGNGDEPDEETDQCNSLGQIADAIRPLGHGLTNPDTVIWDALPWNCGRPYTETYDYPGLKEGQGQAKADKPKPMYNIYRQNTNKMTIATGPDTSQWENPSIPRMFNGVRMDYDNMIKYTYLTAVKGYTYTASNTYVTPFGANYMFWANNFGSKLAPSGQTEHDILFNEALIRFLNTPGNETNKQCPENINCLQ